MSGNYAIRKQTDAKLTRTYDVYPFGCEYDLADMSDNISLFQLVCFQFLIRDFDACRE